jgi:hypothetical protein
MLGRRPQDRVFDIARHIGPDFAGPTERGFDFSQVSIHDSEPGRPLPEPIRKPTEQATGADLSPVRLHTGGAAAAAATSLGARAFTVGRDVHFGPGQFEPTTHEGRRLIAHELVHVIQQGGASAPAAPGLDVSSPDDATEKEAAVSADRIVSGGAFTPISHTGRVQVARGLFDDLADWWKKTKTSWQIAHPYWGPEYKRRRARVGDLTYDRYKSQIGKNTTPDIPDLKAAHKWGGRQLVDPTIKPDELKQIFPLLANDPQLGDKVKELNHAFSIMMIDTVEAQALYLAHAYVESKQFTQMKEVGGEGKSYAPFYGRGPLQVTNEEGYVQSLAYLETRAEQLEKEGKTDDAALAREAVVEIRRQPDAALDPKYTYLFSAAFMHQGGGVRGAHTVTAGAIFHGGPEAGWMIGGNLDAKLANAIKMQREAKTPAERSQGEAIEREIRRAMKKAEEKAAAYKVALGVLGSKPTVPRPPSQPVTPNQPSP